MKTSIDHLPTEKQEELQEILRVIKERLNAEMVILFGSYGRGDWVDDRYKENGTTFEYQSDYDILVVLDSEERAMKREFSKRYRYKIRHDSPRQTPLNVIFHGIDYLNQEIENGNYFFVDILKEGVMLYDNGKYQLSTPKPLSPKERRNKAQRYFDKWFKNAEMFYLDFETNFQRAEKDLDYYNKAAFELHQATERFYMCMLLVYTDYKPKLHDLDKLEKQANKLDNRFKTIFPHNTPEEERLFILLKKAYIDSRYNMEYKITKEELEYLSGCVTKLHDLTEIACKEKIDSFE